jgi:hypothetical protein
MFSLTETTAEFSPAIEKDEAADYYSGDDAEAETFVNPQNIPPLVNFTSGMNLYKWFRFEFDLDYDIDLFECGETVDGRLPVWVLHTEEPLDHLFLSQTVEPYKDGQHPNVDWALQNGVAPGQPFLVEFQAPIYSGGGGRDYNGDYPDVEVEHNIKVVRVLPKSLAGAGKAWAHTLKRIEHEHAKHARRVEHFTRQGMAHKSRWRIVKRYAMGTELRLIADPPKGASNLYTLEIAKGSTQARALNNQYALAFEQLIEDFVRRHPDEDIAPVLALSEGTHTAWDYIKWA